jgi:hypothetical protein
MWKNLSNKEKKKPRAPASKSSIYAGVFTQCWGFIRCNLSCNGGSLGPLSPSLPATSLASLHQKLALLCTPFPSIRHNFFNFSSKNKARVASDPIFGAVLLKNYPPFSLLSFVFPRPPRRILFFKGEGRTA